MAWRKINDSILTDIADAIRAKAGTSDTYRPQEMAIAIESLPEGGDANVPDISICGILEQVGTPTIENPVPVECIKAGTKVRISTPITTVTAWINTSNQLAYSSDSFSARIEVKPNTQYELYLDTTASTLFRAGATASENLPMTGSPIGLSACVRSNTPSHITLNADANAKYIWIQIASGQKQAIYSLTVINKTTGETYKPFSLSEFTNPCDLYTGDVWYPISGKVERSKKRIDLTGTENWSTTSITNAFSFYMPTNPRKKYANGGSVWSNIAVGGLSSVPATTDRSGKVLTVDSASYIGFGYKDNYTIAEWKAYLAAQYAAGTPAYFVYDLETPIVEQYDPETGEPLLMGGSLLMGNPFSMGAPAPSDDGYVEGDGE